MPASRMPAPVRHQLLAATAQGRHSRRLPEKRGSCSCACFQAPWFPGSTRPPTVCQPEVMVLMVFAAVPCKQQRYIVPFKHPLEVMRQWALHLSGRTMQDRFIDEVVTY